MRKRYLGLLIPSIVLYVLGLIGVGFGSYFIVSTQSPQEVANLGEALGMAFAIAIIIAIGACVLAFGLVLIIVATPLFFGGLTLRNKDKKAFLENKDQVK